MKSRVVAQLLADLGVTKSHSRPSVSDDNPFSEAQFKTLKYMPGFPDRFGCIEDARAHCVDFFKWYNETHYHSGIGGYTPAMVHYGWAEEVRTHRQNVLLAAWKKHPERFKKQPVAAAVPEVVYINKPGTAEVKESLT
jgi:putative transposase